MLKLSDRLRPNAEAAPWVIEEVQDMEKELTSLRAFKQAREGQDAVVFHECKGCGYQYIDAPVSQCDCLSENGFQLVKYYANPDPESAEMRMRIDELLAAIKSFGHKPGCRKNAFGDECSCGVDAVIARSQGNEA